MNIDKNLVQKLIEKQFPEWKDLSIHEVRHQGHDNRTFRLGDDLLVRLPSAQCYADKVAKEQRWLGYL